MLLFLPGRIFLSSPPAFPTCPRPGKHSKGPSLLFHPPHLLPSKFLSHPIPMFPSFIVIQSRSGDWANKHQQTFLLPKRRENLPARRENPIKNLPSPASKPALSTPSASPPLPPPLPVPPLPTSTFGQACAKRVAASGPCLLHCCLPGHYRECRSAAARVRGCK